MSAITQWITTNANAVSGYVVLLVVVIAFFWAIGSERLYLGKGVKALKAEFDECQAKLDACQQGRST
jgi:hypothetical protein